MAAIRTPRDMFGGKSAEKMAAIRSCRVDVLVQWNPFENQKEAPRLGGAKFEVSGSQLKTKPDSQL